MSFYRVYNYGNDSVPYKHIYIKRDRVYGSCREADNILNDRVGGSDSKFSESLSRAKRNITELILCNDWEYFCTFTFKPDKLDRFDLDVCFKTLSQYFNNYKKRKSSEFQYLVVPEQHEDGSFHFHGVASNFASDDLIVPDVILKRFDEGLRLVPNTKGYLKWNHYDKNMGIFNCSRIQSVSASAFYVTKYMSKDMKNIPKGSHLYACSKGLKRPELILDVDNYPMFDIPYFENDFCKIAYENSFNTVPVLNENGVELGPWGCYPLQQILEDNENENVYFVSPQYEQTKIKMPCY